MMEGTATRPGHFLGERDMLITVDSLEGKEESGAALREAGGGG